MIKLKEKFVIDNKGKRVGVFLDITDYRKIIEELEELEAVRAYDAASASGDEAIPFEQAVCEIEQNRK